MMYIDLIFVFYIIAMLVSLLCLALIALILVKQEERGNKTYLATRNFALVITMTGLLYFILYYREIVQEQYEIGIPLRLIDYTLSCLMFFCWLMLLGRLLEGGRQQQIFKVAKVLTVVRLICSWIVAAFFMGEYYEIDDQRVCYLWSIGESLFIAVTGIIMIFYGIQGIRECTGALRKKYIFASSFLLLLWSFVQGIVDIGLFTGRFGISAWQVEFPDLTGLIMFLLNLATCIFVFQEDFSPLFFTERPGTDPESHGYDDPRNEHKGENTIEEDDLEVKMDAIAMKHKLTVREREVIGLLYEGYTNPDIAEALFVSINTVKKHIHNIYEKLDVSSRIEVIHMINTLK